MCHPKENLRSIKVTSTSLEEETSGYGLWQGSKLVLATNAPSRPAHYSETIPLPLLGEHNNPETFFLDLQHRVENQLFIIKFHTVKKCGVLEH